ncbi:MAG: hypothetical protein KDK72_06680, partial [Chlamydiia bacterium]|nr:hypothetical protein [Chlamydiia bacterium]
EKLAAATQRMQDALANSYDRIDQSSIEEGFNDIIRNYPDFDEETQRARVLLTDFNNAFIDKKIAFLEQRNNEALDAEALEQKNRKLTKAMQAQQARLAKLESQVKHTPPANQPTASSNKMTIWMPAEEQYYEEWAQGNPGATMNEYYDDLATFAGTYRGTIKPYNREVTNKPGDYILLNNNHTPVAYLYSTRVDLQDLIGQTVTIKAVPRPNNNFALKAYYVLSVEE